MRKLMKIFLVLLIVGQVFSQPDPDLFEFNQSTMQAAYFFESVSIDGEVVERIRASNRLAINSNGRSPDVKARNGYIRNSWPNKDAAVIGLW